MISPLCRRLLSFCLLVGAILCLSTPASAQNGAGDCYPDCPTSLWGPLQRDTILLVPCNEVVYIEFKTRLACGVWNDVEIVRIVFANGYAGGMNCGMSMTIKQMVDNATAQLLQRNKMGFPPPLSAPNGTCVSNWRVMKGACWRSTFPVQGAGGPSPDLGMVHGSRKSSGGAKSVMVPDGFLEPCSFTVCCLESFQVCIQDGQRVITPIPGPPFTGECDPNGLLNCAPVCN